MKLNTLTAQKIVKRAMQIIPHSINVMDENGVIIASGDSSRLGELHTGAVIVLRQNKPIEIDKALEQEWQREAREGINLPIRYMGKMLGVVGISGSPDVVRPYAEWVKMVAELIIEQAVLLEQERWRHRYKEEFVRQLLQNTLSPAEITQQASFFKLPFNEQFVAILIQFRASTPEDLQSMISHLEQQEQHLVAIWDLDEIIFIKSIKDVAQLRKENVLKMLLPDSNLNYKMIVGSAVSSLNDIHLSYQSARQTMVYVEKYFPRKQYIFFDDYRLPALLSNFSQSWAGKELAKPINPLLKQDKNELLLKSLRQYFLSNCDLSHASKKLFIHPNTLRYRLSRIEEITGLFFNRIEDQFILYLGAFSAH